jgi:hypothetical protein
MHTCCHEDSTFKEFLKVACPLKPNKLCVDNLTVYLHTIPILIVLTPLTHCKLSYFWLTVFDSDHRFDLILQTKLIINSVRYNDRRQTTRKSMQTHLVNVTIVVGTQQMCFLVCAIPTTQSIAKIQ